MPRDSNGVFTRLINYVAGTKARANDVNTNELDIAEALTDSLRKSSSLADVPDKAAARSALGVPSASDAYTRYAVHDFAASPTSLLTYDLPDTASRFRCSLEGITPANVEVLVSMRCGVAGQAPDQGADDYATRLRTC